MRSNIYSPLHIYSLRFVRKRKENSFEIPGSLIGLARAQLDFLSRRLTEHFVRFAARRSILRAISPVNDRNRNTVSIAISITPTSASLIAASLFIAIHPLDKSIGSRVTAHLHTCTHAYTRVRTHTHAYNDARYLFPVVVSASRNRISPNLMVHRA